MRFTWTQLFPWQRRPGDVPDPKQLITYPPVEATVKRQGQAYIIRWMATADCVKIFSGPTPEMVDRQRPLLQVSHQNEAVIAGLDTAVRHYFELAFCGGPASDRRLMVAERILPLEGAVNFRDLGGYQTINGQRVRWGKVYRASALHSLSEADQAYLQRLGIRLICDLRSHEEIARRPNRLPPRLPAQYLHRPIKSVDGLSRLRGLSIVLFQRHRLADVMLDGYRQVMIDENAAVIGEILLHLADPMCVPAIVHCTAGKDRTGVVAALLLHVLGVPEDVVVADYTISNLYYEQFRRELQPDVKPLARFGVTIDDLHPLLTVRAETLRGAMDHIRRRYGSVETYLREMAGVSDQTLRQLRTHLLE